MLQDKCIRDVMSTTTILSIENKSSDFPSQMEKDGSSQQTECLLTFYFTQKKGNNYFDCNRTLKKNPFD